jgi:hypothetical protein
MPGRNDCSWPERDLVECPLFRRSRGEADINVGREPTRGLKKSPAIEAGPKSAVASGRTIRADLDRLQQEHPMPLALTDHQMDVILRAARPLDPGLRAPFLEAVAHALRDQPIGDGSVARVCAQVQRQFWRPPDLSGSRGVSRWR